MKSMTEEDNLESLPTGVFELPGEPAVVINGVPEIPADNGNDILSICPVDGNLGSENPSAPTTDTEKPRNIGFGEWMEGREVRKLFGDTYYSGTVKWYDGETGWYRVVYADGDFEDLEWHELRDILLPLDITLPLKSLASKIIRKSYSSEHGFSRKVVGEATKGAKTGGRRARSRGSSSRGS